LNKRFKISPLLFFIKFHIKTLVIAVIPFIYPHSNIIQEIIGFIQTYLIVVRLYINNIRLYLNLSKLSNLGQYPAV